MHGDAAIRKRILFVDDETINLLSVRALFRRDYDVFTADSAAAGLRILRKESMDAVVADQRMPIMTGVELFASLPGRERTGLRLVLTGYSADQEIEKALSNGTIDAVLEKPLDYASLVRHIEGDA
jgi:response regulator RpfG family c-di-GMP phosphodiesterase